MGPQPTIPLSPHGLVHSVAADWRTRLLYLYATVVFVCECVKNFFFEEKFFGGDLGGSAEHWRGDRLPNTFVVKALSVQQDLGK